MDYRILAIGDIVGAPGRDAVRHLLGALRSERRVDLVIANAENAAGGDGLTPPIARSLFAAGVDVITTGDHVWRHREIVPYLEQEQRVLRPANYAPGAAGSGMAVAETAGGVRVAVVNLIGRIFMPPADSPFVAVERLLEQLDRHVRLIIVDFHAEATAEKIAMGWALDGRVTAVLGTHTHVQTADECVRPGGTGYITDLGMTGPHRSVIGRRIEPVLYHLTRQMREPFGVASEDVRLCGALVTADTVSGRTVSIERINVPFERPVPASSSGDSAREGGRGNVAGDTEQGPASR